MSTILLPNRNKVIDPFFGLERTSKILDRLTDPWGRPYDPTDIQLDLLNSRARNQIWLMGRRAGKSTTAAIKAILTLLKPRKLIWIAAPTYGLSEKIFRVIYDISVRCLPYMIEGKPRYSKDEMSIHFKTGSRLLCYTAKNLTNLVGDSIDLLITDESGDMPNMAIELMAPSLTDINPMTGRAKGQFIAVGTPRTHNWYKEYYDLGKQEYAEETFEEMMRRQHSIYENLAPGELMYESFTASTFSNPHIDLAAVRNEMKRKPYILQRQEYYAEFQEEGGVVFPITKAMMYPVGFMDLRRGATTFVGIDIARSVDYTVVFAMNQRFEQVDYWRPERGQDWHYIKSGIKQKLSSLAENGPVTVCIDETSAGSPLTEEFKNYFSNAGHVTVEGVNFSGGRQLKNALVEDMIMAVGDNIMKFWDMPEIYNEIADYAVKIDANPLPKYGAPKGKHDDIPTAAMLACHAVKLQRPDVFVLS